MSSVMQLVHFFDDTENDMNRLCGMTTGSEKIVIELDEYLMQYVTAHFKEKGFENDEVTVNHGMHKTFYGISDLVHSNKVAKHSEHSK